MEDINYRVVDMDAKWRIIRRHWRFAFWAVWVSLGPMMIGFDSVAGGQLIAMPAFQQKYAGDFFGALICGYLMDYTGRKRSVLLAATISCVGIGLQYVSATWRVFFAGKFINGIAFGIWFTVAPTWIGENARPECRGFFLCLYNSSIVYGQALVVFISKGLVRIPGKWSFQSTILLQFLFPALGYAGYLFFAESPYWLLSRDMDDDARKALRKLYGSNYQEFRDIEFDRLSENVRFSTNLRRMANEGGLAVLKCFRGTNLKRTMTSLLAAAGQQLLGASFVLGYVTYFLELVHVENTFLVTVILFVVMIISTTSTFVLIEILGRRTLLVPATFVLTFILLLIGIMGCIPNQVAAGWVITVCIFIWGAIYQLSLGSTGFVMASELSTLTLRAQTQSLVAATDSVVAGISGFTIPYMINPDAGNMGGKVGFVFFAMGVFVCIGYYFFIPETKGLSFDDMDWLYAQKVSPRKFQEAIKDRIGSDGGVWRTVTAVEKVVADAKETHIEHV
ncbi:hypothetical protein V1520DRAFT_278984 [Lipomyces starkeyi]|uniref:Major facilitator superfamily (MFS) profile domain-containing protein n=1 Tax=Lipomyces starkeyi NRRL Y-11557 TaxID=675824 RepID=A0A1E3PXB0_LIPST|nr:hypothetical protein LIPSTDRAFT_120442 [Lipomyces starkeyi NRRL Y-11557]